MNICSVLGLKQPLFVSLTAKCFTVLTSKSVVLNTKWYEENIEGHQPSFVCEWVIERGAGLLRQRQNYMINDKITAG